MLREEDAGVEHEDMIDDEADGVVDDIVPVEENVVSVEEPPDVFVKQEEIVAEPQEGWFGVGRGEEE